MHVFTRSNRMKRDVQEKNGGGSTGAGSSSSSSSSSMEAVLVSHDSGCTLCHAMYNSKSDEISHLNGKLHRMNVSNEKEWQAYLKYMHPT